MRQQFGWIWILLLVNTVAVRAQSDSLVVGLLVNRIFPTGQGLTVVKTDLDENPTVVTLEYLNDSVRMTATRTISLLHRGLPSRLEAAFEWNGRINLLTSFFFPGPKRHHLILQQFDPLDSLRETFVRVISESYLPEGSPAPAHYAISPDSSRLLFVSWELGIAEDPTRLHFLVYDQQMRPRRDERVLLPYTNDRSYLDDVALRSNEEIILLFEYYTGKLSRWASPSATQVDRFALLFDAAGNEPESLPLRMPDKHLPMEYRMALDRQENLIVAGFYRHRSKQHWAGAFWHRQRAHGGGFDRRYVAIDRHKLQAAYGGPQNTIEVMRHPFTRYRLDHLLLNELGETTLLAERIYEQQSREVYRTGPGLLLPDQYFDDLLVVRFDPRGNLRYLTRLPKQQKAPSWLSNRMSYQVAQDSSLLYLIYNDLPDNYQNRSELTRLERFENERDIPLVAQIDERGAFRYFLLNGIRTPNFSVRPRLSIPLPNERMLFYEEFLGKEYRYLMSVINIGRLSQQ